MDLWLLKKEVNKMGGYEAVRRVQPTSRVIPHLYA